MVEVRVEDVRKTYGKVEALKGASLTFASGAMTAILGASIGLVIFLIVALDYPDAAAWDRVEKTPAVLHYYDFPKNAGAPVSAR